MSFVQKRDHFDDLFLGIWIASDGRISEIWLEPSFWACSFFWWNTITEWLFTDALCCTLLPSWSRSTRSHDTFIVFDLVNFTISQSILNNQLWPSLNTYGSFGHYTAKRLWNAVLMASATHYSKNLLEDSPFGLIKIFRNFFVIKFYRKWTVTGNFPEHQKIFKPQRIYCSSVWS